MYYDDNYGVMYDKVISKVMSKSAVYFIIFLQIIIQIVAENYQKKHRGKHFSVPEEYLIHPSIEFQNIFNAYLFFSLKEQNHNKRVDI